MSESPFPALTLFLLRHQGEIDRSYYVQDELHIEFRREVSKDRVLTVMVDLVTTCQPRSVILSRDEDHETLSVSFHV